MQATHHFYMSWHSDMTGMTAGGQHKLHYKSWGDRSKEDIVLCLHGLTRSCQDFDELAEDLVRHLECRVISIDMAGRGQSDWLPSPQAYHMHQYCQDVMVLMQMLNAETQAQQNRFHLVGTSMGGMIGMGLVAGQAPLTSLCMNDIGPFIPKSALEEIAQYVATSPKEFNSLSDAGLWAQDAISQFGPLSEQQWQKMMSNVLVRDEEGATRQWKRHYDPQIVELLSVSAQQGSELPDIDMWAWWDKVNLPVLVLRGEYSTLLTSDVLEKMSLGRMTRFETYICPKTGHTPMLMKQDEISVIREWVQSQISKKI